MPADTTLSFRRSGWGPRRWLGLAIAVAGIAVLALQFTQFLQAHPRVAQAWQGGLVAALATALGTLPVVFSQRLSERVQDTLFGFGAGVMLAACSFSLIIPGLAAAKDNGAGAWGAGGIIGGSILLGGLARLISSAISNWPKIGPFMKRKERRPLSS